METALVTLCQQMLLLAPGVPANCHSREGGSPNAWIPTFVGMTLSDKVFADPFIPCIWLFLAK
jgi:hypothetical protein